MQPSSQSVGPADQQNIDSGRLKKLFNYRGAEDNQDQSYRRYGLNLLDQGANDAEDTTEKRQRQGPELEARCVWFGLSGGARLTDRAYRRFSHQNIVGLRLHRTQLTGDDEARLGPFLDIFGRDSRCRFFEQEPIGGDLYQCQVGDYFGRTARCG